MLLFLFQDDADNQATSEKKDGAKKKKQLVKTLELPIEAYTHGYSQAELKNYVELEVSNKSHVHWFVISSLLMQRVQKMFTSCM